MTDSSVSRHYQTSVSSPAVDDLGIIVLRLRIRPVTKLLGSALLAECAA
jgi:hypothetical protein